MDTREYHWLALDDGNVEKNCELCSKSLDYPVNGRMRHSNPSDLTIAFNGALCTNCVGNLLQSGLKYDLNKTKTKTRVIISSKDPEYEKIVKRYYGKTKEEIVRSTFLHSTIKEFKDTWDDADYRLRETLVLSLKSHYENEGLDSELAIEKIYEFINKILKNEYSSRKSDQYLKDLLTETIAKDSDVIKYKEAEEEENRVYRIRRRFKGNSRDFFANETWLENAIDLHRLESALDLNRWLNIFNFMLSSEIEDLYRRVREIAIGECRDKNFDTKRVDTHLQELFKDLPKMLYALDKECNQRGMPNLMAHWRKKWGSRHITAIKKNPLIDLFLKDVKTFLYPSGEYKDDTESKPDSYKDLEVVENELSVHEWDEIIVNMSPQDTLKVRHYIDSLLKNCDKEGVLNSFPKLIKSMNRVAQYIPNNYDKIEELPHMAVGKWYKHGLL